MESYLALAVRLIAELGKTNASLGKIPGLFRGNSRIQSSSSSSNFPLFGEGIIHGANQSLRSLNIALLHSSKIANDSPSAIRPTLYRSSSNNAHQWGHCIGCVCSFLF